MKKKIFSLFIIFILLFLLIYLYKNYYFNDYTKALKTKGITTFYRESKDKYNKQDSYSIYSKDYNVAVFRKEINVKKNTPYKVTCYVKTENVTNRENKLGGGANICIIDSSEMSNSITGTNSWTKLEFMFNSKNRNTVNIGFRLGDFENEAKGKVFFSDIKLEEGKIDSDNNWNIGCFVFNNVDFNINEKEYNFSMTDEDLNLINNDLNLLKYNIKEYSKNNISMNINTYYIDEPIKKVSYDEVNGYYIDPLDIYDSIINYVQDNNLDYIFAVFKSDELNKKTDTEDWVGLGGMEFLGIGFSNIRVPLKDGRQMFKYSDNNLFPEEVFLHEFLHTLERNSNLFSFEVPDLHEYLNYGYKVNNQYGLKKWYLDYMNKEIEHEGNYIGIDKSIYTISKPLNNENFNTSIELEFDKEPKNLVELVKLFIYNSKKLILNIEKGDAINLI